MRTLLCALGLSWGAMGFCDYVVDGTTYSFTAQTGLNLCGLTEWSVINATDSSYETSLTTATFDVLTDTSDNSTYLDFSTSSVSQDEDDVLLALGLSTGATTYGAIPLTTTAVSTTTYRLDTVTVEVVPVMSDTLPDIATLKKMYASAADATPGASSTLIAAKMGVCVGPDGYFYVSRVRSGSTSSTSEDSSGDGTSANVVFEWCKTGVDFAGGRVQIKISIATYMYSDDTMGAGYARAYSVEVYQKARTTPTWESLTDGLGYTWMAATDGGYYIDFSSLGDGKWLFFVDENVVTTGSYDYTDVDYLHQLGFAATEGSLYSVDLAVNGTGTNTAAVASAYSNEALGSFASYVNGSSMTGTATVASTLLEQWIDRYNVDLTKYLVSDDGTATVATLAALTDTTASTSGTTESAYEAFLLNMDPESTAAHELIVTGIVPDESQVTITVKGPEGCDLTQLEAAEVLIRRSASLSDLDSATPTAYPATLNSNDGSLTFVMSRTDGDVELPFMRAELSALDVTESSTEATE